MKKLLSGLAIGFTMLSLLVITKTAALAEAVDYASTTSAIDDATSGLPAVLFSGSMKVVGIALGIWALFFIIGKLRKHTK